VFPINCGQFKIALCQLYVQSEKNQNLARAANLIKVAVEKGARLVVLPVSGLTTHVIVGL
jgi:predicted amidohydrolase